LPPAEIAGSTPDDLVLVAYVSGAYGLKGWVRLKTYSNEASALLYAKCWWLDKPELHDVEVLAVRTQGEDVVAQIMGIADREAAENCRGVTVQIRRAHFPPLEDNEFYWVDLIGHVVVNLRGELLGSVKKPEEILIPFVDQFVTTVDQLEKKITVDWERDY